MLDAKVVSDDTVHSCATVIQIIFSQHNQDSILSLLALDENCVTAEQPQGLHGVIRETDDGIIIVDGIGNAVATCQQRAPVGSFAELGCCISHQRVWLLFLLEDSCCCVVNLSTISAWPVILRAAWTYFFLLSSGGIAVKLL